jgi:hypothetical protein
MIIDHPRHLIWGNSLIRIVGTVAIICRAGPPGPLFEFPGVLTHDPVVNTVVVAITPDGPVAPVMTHLPSEGSILPCLGAATICLRR